MNHHGYIAPQSKISTAFSIQHATTTQAAQLVMRMRKNYPHRSRFERSGSSLHVKQQRYTQDDKDRERRREKIHPSLSMFSPSRLLPNRSDFFLHSQLRETIVDKKDSVSATINDIYLMDSHTDDLTDDCTRTTKCFSPEGDSEDDESSPSAIPLETRSFDFYGVPIGSIILLNFVAVIWGTQHAVIKTVIESGIDGNDGATSYFTLARFGLAAVLAAPYTPGWEYQPEKTELANEKVTSHSLVDEKNQNSITIDTSAGRMAWRYGGELGLYMFMGYAFQAIGLETTSASRSGFLLYLNVKFVPFLSYVIFGKRISRGTWISAFVAFCGTALLAFDFEGEGATTMTTINSNLCIGDIWSIAAAISSAMFILRMESASKAVTRSSELNAATLWTVAALSILWATIISFGKSNIDDCDGAIIRTNGESIINAVHLLYQQTCLTISTHLFPLLYLSGVTTALANFLQSKAQKDISAERASVIYAMDPVYGAIFANFLLGETLGTLGLVGALLIVVAAATNASLDLGTKRYDDE